MNQRGCSAFFRRTVHPNESWPTLPKLDVVGSSPIARSLVVFDL